MQSWREETSEDLREARRKIEGVIPGVSGPLTEAQADEVWLAYVLVEKSVFFIKVELDDENPGRFIKARSYSVPDERQALQFALRRLESGAEEFRLGDLVQSLKMLREARNYLRVLVKTAWKHARSGRPDDYSFSG